MAEASQHISHKEGGRADIATRWQKGQSGNPKGRPRKARDAGIRSIGANGAGATPTYLARVMIERPVERADGLGGTRTRLTEYMADLAERADAGDLKCRMLLIRYVDQGDRRRLEARRNAEKAKTRARRELERAAAREISLTPEAPPERAAAEVKTVFPTQPSRVQTIAVPKRKVPLVEASTFRRDPRTGELLGADGSPLSREEEERLLYPNWPHISPHLKKDDAAGLNTGQKIEAKTGSETGSITGLETGPRTGPRTGIANPVSRTQGFDSAQNSESEKNSRKNSAAETNRKDTLH